MYFKRKQKVSVTGCRVFLLIFIIVVLCSHVKNQFSLVKKVGSAVPASVTFHVVLVCHHMNVHVLMIFLVVGDDFFKTTGWYGTDAAEVIIRR